MSEACEPIGFADVVAVEAPAVIVLGERHGTQPDLSRAARVVHALGERAPVTVAVEAVHERYQPVLDEFAAGTIDAAELPLKLEWEQSWGFDWAPYARLVTAALDGATVVAAGTDLGPAPEDAPDYPVPPAYIRILSDAMAGHAIPPEREDKFVRSMAWRDYRIATNALGGWNGEGYLVVVAGRGHVEGGKGVAWQVDQRVDTPVHAFVLAWGGDPPCYAGDRVWRKGFLG